MVHSNVLYLSWHRMRRLLGAMSGYFAVAAHFTQAIRGGISEDFQVCREQGL